MEWVGDGGVGGGYGVMFDMICEEVVLVVMGKELDGLLWR